MKRTLALASLSAIFATTSTQAATILIDDDFESGTIESWSVVNGGNAGLYQNGDVVANMSAGDSATNFAPNGQYSLWDGNGSSYLVLTNALTLDTQLYTQVQISFNYNFRNGSGTRKLSTLYSSDGGATWTELGKVTYSGSKTYTLNEGSPHTFSDNALFRFAFADSGGGAGPAFIDDIVISGTPEFIIPEPGSLALMSIGGLLIARRRRG